jgi:hypothetical protein
MASQEADFAKKDILSAFHAEDDDDELLIPRQSDPDPVLELTGEEK